MANPHRGQAAITIAGKERTLRIDMDAVAEIQDALGINAEMVLQIATTRNIKAYRVVLVAGLRHEWPEVTAADIDPPEDQSIAEWLLAVSGPITQAIMSAYLGNAKAKALQNGETTEDSPPDPPKRRARRNRRASTSPKPSASAAASASPPPTSGG